jgi:hypothetical protein
MTHRRPLFWFLLLAAAAHMGCDRGQEAPQQAQPGVPPAPAPSPTAGAPGATAPDGLLADVREDLADAREDLAEQERDDAAEELRDAAGKLRRYAQSAAGDVRQDVMNAATELDAIAGEVSSGAITSTTMLDRRLAGTHAALAKAHVASSRETWGRRDLSAAGRGITAAADDLETGLTRLGRGIDADAAAAIRDARDVGERLVRGAEATPADVERVFESLEREIEKLHREAGSRQG